MTEENKNKNKIAVVTTKATEKVGAYERVQVLEVQLAQVTKQMNTMVSSVRRNDMLQPKSLAEIFDLSVQIANSGMMKFNPKDAQEISVRIITGMEMGFSAMHSIRNIYNVHGIPSPSTDALVSLIISSPFCLFFKKIDSESDATKATVETQRIGYDAPSRYVFTIKDAETAGLLGKDNWKKYPAVMLYKRAAAFLCRQVYPDVAMGLHTVEEMESMAFSETEKVNEKEQALQKSRAEALSNMNRRIEELLEIASTKDFAGHLLDAFNHAKRVDYVADASHADVIGFSEWLTGSGLAEVIGFVAKYSKSYAESLEKKVNPAPDQDTPEGDDDRDEWKHQNRHVRKVLSEAGVPDPNEVLRAFKIAKNKKSLTEIPAKQIEHFIDDLQAFGGDRIKGSRAIDDEFNATVAENAEAFRKYILCPHNSEEIDHLESTVFSSLSPEDIKKVEAKFVSKFDNINTLEECQPDDIAALADLLEGGLEEVQAYIGGSV